MTDKTNKMLVTIVLDRSGSMENQREGTISGFNEYINGLRSDKEGEYNVSLIQFDANGTVRSPDLTISYIDKPLAEVPVMTESDYVPRGNTPLLDAIGECVRRVDAIKGERAATCVIITDGMENASQEFKKADIQALVKRKEAEAWTFVFIGANIDSYGEGATLGMRAGNTANYAPSNVGAVYTNSASATLRRGVMNRSVGVGGASAMSFFSETEKLAIEKEPEPEKQPNTGGQPAGASSFRKRVAGDPHKPRQWGENKQ